MRIIQQPRVNRWPLWLVSVMERVAFVAVIFTVIVTREHFGYGASFVTLVGLLLVDGGLQARRGWITKGCGEITGAPHELLERVADAAVADRARDVVIDGVGNLVLGRLPVSWNLWRQRLKVSVTTNDSGTSTVTVQTRLTFGGLVDGGEVGASPSACSKLFASRRGNERSGPSGGTCPFCAALPDFSCSRW